MLRLECMPDRRSFLRGGVGMAVGLSLLPLFPHPARLRRTPGLSDRNRALRPRSER